MRPERLDLVPDERGQVRERPELDSEVPPRPRGEVFTKGDLEDAPPGVVVTSESDAAWTAGLALAAGRGDLIAWTRAFDDPNGGMTLARSFFKTSSKVSAFCTISSGDSRVKSRPPASSWSASSTSSSWG